MESEGGTSEGTAEAGASEESKLDEGGESRSQGLPSRYFREKPVKLGDELDVTVSETSRKGDGVARVEGYVIFIPGAGKGQHARIRITMIRPNYAVAEMVSGQPATS